MGPAAHHQVQRHHAHPVYGYREVKTHGYSSFIVSFPTRFLATEYGLTGRTSLEGAQADEIVDACTDIVNARAGAVFEPDEGKKAEKMQAYLSQTLPTGMVMIYIFKIDPKCLSKKLAD